MKISDIEEIFCGDFHPLKQISTSPEQSSTPSIMLLVIMMSDDHWSYLRLFPFLSIDDPADL